MCTTYHPLHENESCNIDMIHEVENAKFGVAEVALSSQEIGEILRTKCCEKDGYILAFVFIFAVVYVRCDIK